MYDENYLEWVKQANLPPLTREQYQFAAWLIQNNKHINVAGDLDVIFSSVRKWLRSGVELWEEYILGDEIEIENIPAADFDEKSEEFDWNLSLWDIQLKYKNKKSKYGTIEAAPLLLDLEIEGVDYVFSMDGKKRKCYRIGIITANMGNTHTKGQSVFYNEKANWYYIKYGNRYITYVPNSISKLIQYNGKLPNGKPNDETLTDFVNRITVKENNEEQQNFHYE